MSRGKTRAGVKKNRSGMVLIIVVVSILLVVLLSRCVVLKQRNAAYADEIASLEEQYTEEEGRIKQIESYKEYTKTDSFVEKTAREKFGLVYPDETIFREEK